MMHDGYFLFLILVLRSLEADLPGVGRESGRNERRLFFGGFAGSTRSVLGKLHSSATAEPVSLIATLKCSHAQ